MVKVVVGEETRLTSAVDLLSHSAIPAEVGLVIGKLSSALDRGFVFGLIPKPSNDAGEPACTNGSTRGSILGDENVNVSFMSVGRIAPRKQAVMGIGVDEQPSKETLKKI